MANGRGGKNWRDPRGHSLRIYDEVFDSPAFRALSPHDVLAYLALLRELRGTNNGDLSLTLTRSKRYGIKHHNTLASCLRALCAVGLIAITRKGGCSKGGTKLATLYRVTDVEAYEVPAKGLEYCKATNDWKAVTSVEHGQQLIRDHEERVKGGPSKKNNLGHAVTATMSRGDVVEPKTRTRRDSRGDRPCHAVSLVKNGANPMPMRVSEGFSGDAEKPSPRTCDMPPLYIATPTGNFIPSDESGNYKQLTRRQIKLFTELTH